MTSPKSNKSKTFHWIYFITPLVVFLGACLDVNQVYQPFQRGWGVFPDSLLLLFSLSLLWLIAVTFILFKPEKVIRINQQKNKSSTLRYLGFFIIPFGIAFILIFTIYSNVLSGFWLRLWITTISILSMAWLFTYKRNEWINWRSLLLSALVFCAIFTLSSLFASAVSYPFPLYWSEGNRFWDYSLIFGRDRYIYPPDQPIPAQVEDLRQFIWGIAFLWPGLSIQGMRLWDVILMTFPYALLGYFLFKRSSKHLWIPIVCALWSFLFLNQGPVYTDLVLAAVLVAISLYLPMIPQLVLVGFTSYLLAIERNHWMIAPAFWSILAIFVGGFIPPKAKVKNPWWRSILVAITGFAYGFVLPILIRYFNKLSTTSPISMAASMIDVDSRLGAYTFIWNRLLPSPTNPMGILPMLGYAILPVLFLIVLFIRKRTWQLSIWQWLVFVSFNAIFLIIGMVISVKIGGGNNLHNLDMLLIGILISASIAWESGLKKWFLDPETKNNLIKVFLLIVIILPALPGITSGKPLQLPDQWVVAEALQKVQDAVNIALPNGEILFIDHRQLLTFGEIQNVHLVPEYEKKQLMNLAIGGNSDQLQGFYQDLIKRRFSLIVSEVLEVNFQRGTKPFSEENNAWVSRITMPIICYYEPLYTNREIGLQLLTPREDIAIGFNGLLCPGASQE